MFNEGSLGICSGRLLFADYRAASRASSSLIAAETVVASESVATPTVVAVVEVPRPWYAFLARSHAGADTA